MLRDVLLKEYGVESSSAHIFTQPSLRNKTIYDYNVNMLRTTSECMSAILGGSTTVNNMAYDAMYHKKNEFGERIARNQLLILQQESYLESANKMADGSYYIENLTSQLAEKALVIFKEIERGGGFLKQLKQGVIQRKIEESARTEQEQFNNTEIILLGSNKQPNADDTNRPERATPEKKRIIIFSPHPDDDVISMGGTFNRLVEQGHDVHIAYQTSGNIAVSDEEALKFAEVTKSLNIESIPNLK